MTDQERITQLEARIAQLEARLAALEGKINANESEATKNLQVFIAQRGVPTHLRLGVDQTPLIDADGVNRFKPNKF